MSSIPVSYTHLWRESGITVDDETFWTAFSCPGGLFLYVSVTAVSYTHLIGEPGEMDILTAIAQPDICVITTIGVAHIEYMGSLENTRKEKLSIIKGMGCLLYTSSWTCSTGYLADSPMLRLNSRRRNLQIHLCRQRGLAGM